MTCSLRLNAVGILIVVAIVSRGVFKVVNGSAGRDASVACTVGDVEVFVLIVSLLTVMASSSYSLVVVGRVEEDKVAVTFGIET